MARWRLTAPHYLKVEGTKWEYTETDRTSGRPKRTQFDVPTYLNPDWETDWNYTERDGMGRVVEGMVVVSDGHNPQPKDIIFDGTVTPDMAPMDEEAEAITKSMQSTWVNPMGEQAFPSNGFAEALIESLQKQMAEASVKQSSDTGGLAEVLAGMTAIMKQNSDMLASIARPAGADDRFAALEERLTAAMDQISKLAEANTALQNQLLTKDQEHRQAVTRRA
jgi:hypothetical protein